MADKATGRWRRRDGLALLSLVGVALLVFWRLALTDLVIGRGDIFFYFYPYRDYASAAARAGRVPLWNPYLFMGAPFLANSQAGFFYPPNLALAWLPVARMVNASILLHAALAAAGAFLWGRGGLGLGRSGAWLAGLCYGLGGYFVAQVEHLNQVQVLAWLPWLLWGYEASGEWRGARGVWGVVTGSLGVGLVVALQFLAGHIQSVFICLVGLAGYALLPVAWEVVRGREAWRALVRPALAVLLAAVGGGALAAVQLLPTLELTRLSVRSGGLPYKEAVSFSLRPGLVGRALLPGWGTSLFPEFVAYVGVVGLGLAALGAGRMLTAGRPTEDFRSGQVWRARRGALTLAALGLFFALGGFNPLYFVLVKLVPGFGLFRAPARWLALYAVGVAGLAGIGLEGLAARRGGWRFAPWVVYGVVGSLVLLAQVVGGDPEPDLAPPLGRWSPAGWAVAALFFAAALYSSRAAQSKSDGRLLKSLLVTAVVIELFGASLFLPFNRATAPGALTSLRPAVAYLLAQAEAAGTGPADRFLSISDIFFDPGDKGEITANLGSQLPEDALYDYVIATKQKEVLIPNLPLYCRLPAMDGYDGGVLPLRHYVTLERLYMPQEQVALDGRLRENLKAVPDGRWLSLFNVRFVVTDKVGDAWFDGVFYDLQMGARLGLGERATVGHVPAMASTAVGVVYRAPGAPVDTLLAELYISFADGHEVQLPLRAQGAEGGDQVVRLAWDAAKTPMKVTEIEVRGAWPGGEVVVRGLSLIDERTDVFRSLVLSDTGRYRLVHSGDVKIYENLDVLPRLFFVPQAMFVGDNEAALAAMRGPGFNPRRTVVIVGDAPAHESPSSNASPSSPNTIESIESVKLELYEPEQVVATVNAPADGWLWLGDAWYPGWQARVDGRPVPVERANVLFRALPVPAGVHRVEWVYRPVSWRLGVIVSLGAVLVALIGYVWFRR